MKDICKRLRKAEKVLNATREHKTVSIVLFGGEIPPDRTEGNITIHCVKYDEKRDYEKYN